MDGVTKQLHDYLGGLEKLGAIAVESIKEQIDIEADAMESALRDTTPKGSGGLARSLAATSIDTPKRYGRKLLYDGENERGIPYEKIANILEYGTSSIRPRRFIRKVVKQLKGLDDRAAERFENKTKDIENGS
jgi:hypothetical protein